MFMKDFDPKLLKKLYRPGKNSNGEDNGQIVIIGGSKLFHGAPILSLKAASRIVDMVFFASPEKSIEKVAARIKSELFSFVWVPWEEVEIYLKKSDAVLIGPGFMRYSTENNNHHVKSGDCDEACILTRDITKSLLSKFPNKRWVIDAGSLQSMDPDWIPSNSILTPNRKEFEMLFKENLDSDYKVLITKYSKKHNCTIVLKGPETIVASSEKTVVVRGGNAGLTKGGTGDVQAGLTAALYAKNDAFLSAAAASYLVKKSAESLFKKVGFQYNADDLAGRIPKEYNNILKITA